MKIQVIECYHMFLALKTHFESNTYSYFKYNGKLRKFTDLSLRKDRYQFQKLSKIVNGDEIRDFIVSNMVYKNRKWVGDFLTNGAKNTYLEFKKRKESFSYIFNEDLEKINLKEDFKIVDGQNPKILELIYADDITIETFIYLNKYGKFFDRFSNELVDDILWPDLKKKCIKYFPFIVYQDNLKKIFKNHLTKLI